MALLQLQQRFSQQYQYDIEISNDLSNSYLYKIYYIHGSKFCLEPKTILLIWVIIWIINEY